MYDPIHYLNTLHECDRELERLASCFQNWTLRKQDGALGRVKQMEAAVIARRAQLVRSLQPRG